MKCGLLYVCMMMLLVGTAKGQGVVYVAQGGAGNGSSWAAAMGDLQAAIEKAHAMGNAKVRVKAGTYTPTGWPNGGADVSRNVHFSLRNGVKVIGGFAGTETTDTPTGGPTVLSGNLGGGLYAYNVFYHPANSGNTARKVRMNATAVLSNVTIRDGRADGPESDYNMSGGGAINSGYGDATVEHCVFTNNQAIFGGAVLSDNGTLQYTACTFSANSATTSGGAIYNNNYSGATVAHCVFTNNQANWGGAVYNESSAPKYTACAFSANNATYGGAVYNSNGSAPQYTACAFSANNATYGGAVYNYNGNASQYTACTFSANSATDYGGAVYNSNGSAPQYTACTFSANSASNYGGAMYNNTIDATVGHCMFTNNQARYGGAAYNYYGTPKCTACTFSANSATTNGGAVYNNNGTHQYTACTFSANSATTSGGAYYGTGAANAATFTNAVFSNNVSAASGGAVYASSGTCQFNKVEFSGNQARTYGGAIYSNGGAHQYTACTLFGNTAQRGGAIYASGTHTLSNSTIADNEAQHGGGIYLTAGNPSTIVNTTLSGNHATVEGGGIYAASTVKLNGALVAGNTAADEASQEIRGTTDAGSTHNIIGLGRWTLEEIFEDINALGKAELKDNGGPTLTLMLAECGPANNQIDPAVESWCPAEDQRGTVRPQNILSDIGAVETAQTHTAPRLVQTAGAATTTVCAGAVMPSLSYTLSGDASNVTLTTGSLPNGVDLVVSNKVATISGTPAATVTPGDYAYTLTSSDHASLCLSAASISGTITVNALPSASFSAPAGVCNGSTYSVTATTFTDGSYCFSTSGTCTPTATDNTAPYTMAGSDQLRFALSIVHRHSHRCM